MKAIEVTKWLYALETLDDLLLEVVDDTLRKVFKKEGVKAIYNYLENNFNLKREDIAVEPEIFLACLEKLLTSAAPVVENLILKNLYHRLELKFEEKKGYGFLDYMEELRG